jgi:hypothetical protein
VQHDGADEGRLSWVDGGMNPEDAIFDDFVARLRSRDANILNASLALHLPVKQ